MISSGRKWWHCVGIVDEGLFVKMRSKMFSPLVGLSTICSRPLSFVMLIKQSQRTCDAACYFWVLVCGPVNAWEVEVPLQL